MKRTFIIFALFFVFIGLIISLPRGRTGAIVAPIRDLAAVPQAFLRQSGRWLRSLSEDRAGLLHQNRLLAAQIEELRAELRQSASLRDENAELRAMLELKKSSTSRLLAAQLVARDVNGWWQMARIDKGADDGVARDLPVIGPQGLIGQVAEVSRRTADVVFLTSPNVQIAARVDQTDIFGIVRGQGVSWRGDASCRMDFIIKSAEVKRAAKVITSGLGSVYPPGLVIGYISRSDLDPSGLFQCAEIIPAADFKALDILFVVLPENPAPDARSAGTEEKAR